MAEAMQNIDIKDFTEIQGVSDSDFVVLSLAGGISGKISVVLLRASISEGITPSIKEGYWWIGSVNQNVKAAGDTPMLRRGTAGIEYRYSSESDTSWRMLVPYSDIKLRYEDMTEEQIAELKFKYSDLTDEEIAELQKPAEDIVEQVTATENAIKEAEEKRVAAEYARQTAESSRQSSEEARKDEEEKRAESESGRKDAETLREAAESSRVSNESGRINAENARSQAEALRVSAEKSRTSAESSRVESENAREEAETDRAASETLRMAAESARVTAENERKNAEASRIDEEANRVSAEESRAVEFATLKEDVTEAANNANNAAAEVRNVPKIQGGTWWVYDASVGDYIDSGTNATGKSPKIVNGTWWIWDEETGEFSDTGQSVSSDYVLTKDKIENVFTGDITTHTHSHLRYFAQVYETAPDFDTLTTWSDEYGTHEFELGNDIYVLNETEPTGYANYKYAKTSQGNMWVRIPQIIEGWQIIMVQQ